MIWMSIGPLFWILSGSIYNVGNAAKEVILLDTRNARDYLNWFKISSNGDLHNGWGELSFEAKLFPSLLLSSLTSTLWRTQYVCDITSDRRVDHWLRTPFMRRHQAQRIEVELGFSIRDCSTFQTPSEIRSCRETFELYIHQSDDEETEFLWTTYQLIDTIAGNRFTSNNFGNPNTSNISNVTVNVKTRGISIKKNGFYLAFRDQGACVSLLYVKVLYRLCENIDQGLVHFDETPTGASLTDIVERDGRCSNYSNMIRTPLGFCKGNGQWTFQESLLSDSCHCQEGYELLIDNQHYLNGTSQSRAICNVCPIGTFKSTAGNDHSCQKCPPNSFTKETGSTVCICRSGFFRLNSSSLTSACIAHPREPRNITIDELDQVSVKISWAKTNDTYYHLQCHHLTPCESYIIYQPRQRFLMNSSVRIIGLDADRNYQIKIFAEQISTRLLSKSIRLTFTTLRPVSRMVRRIQYRRTSFNTIVINWLADDFEQFHLRYWSSFDSTRKILVILNETNYTLTVNDETYFFQIRGRNYFGWTIYTPEQILSLNSMITEENFSEEFDRNLIDSKTILVMGPMTIILLIVVVVVLALIHSKRKRSCRLKAASDCESLDYQKRQVNEHYGPDAYLQSGWNSSMWPPLISAKKTYVDPHTYEDPNKAVMDFARELDPNLIIIESVIGGGEFGDVCRGKLKRPSMKFEVSVAIKTLKQGATEKTRLDFLTEASIMGQFHHENVIYLEGVVTRQHPIMIVTEYMENGSLDSYLRNNEGNSTLNSLQLTKMLHGIASGMKYLSDIKYVHRDLAARNILVNRDLVCKVADFGLSREINEDESYTTKGGKIPIRWTAIEAIDYRKFTSASDVWSFGILCWEVTSFGERPYWNWSNQDVIKAVKNAYRLPAPMSCPNVLYQLMSDCWSDQYLKRPKFGDIERILKEFIDDSNRLVPCKKQESYFVNDPDQPNIAQLTSIAHWFETLQLSHILISLIEDGYTNLSQICHWEEPELLKRLGNVLTPDEEMRLLNDFKRIRSQLIFPSSKSVMIDSGYLV